MAARTLGTTLGKPGLHQSSAAARRLCKGAAAAEGGWLTAGSDPVSCVGSRLHASFTVTHDRLPLSNPSTHPGSAHINVPQAASSLQGLQAISCVLAAVEQDGVHASGSTKHSSRTKDCHLCSKRPACRLLSAPENTVGSTTSKDSHLCSHSPRHSVRRSGTPAAPQQGQAHRGHVQIDLLLPHRQPGTLAGRDLAAVNPQGHLQQHEGSGCGVRPNSGSHSCRSR